MPSNLQETENSLLARSRSALQRKSISDFFQKTHNYILQYVPSSLRKEAEDTANLLIKSDPSKYLQNSNSFPNFARQLNNMLTANLQNKKMSLKADAQINKITREQHGKIDTANVRPSQFFARQQELSHEARNIKGQLNLNKVDNVRMKLEEGRLQREENSRLTKALSDLRSPSANNPPVNKNNFRSPSANNLANTPPVNKNIERALARNWNIKPAEPTSEQMQEMASSVFKPATSRNTGPVTHEESREMASMQAEKPSISSKVAQLFQKRNAPPSEGQQR